MDNGALYVFNAADNAFITSVSTSGGVNAQRYGMVFNPSGTRLYISCRCNSVTVIDTTNNTVVDTISGLNDPIGISLDPTGRKLFVANNGNDTVSIIDTGTKTEITSVAVSKPVSWGQFIGGPSCAPPPSGIAAWWPGDGNARDIAGGFNGNFSDNSYANGKVGQAFSFDGGGGYVEMPATVADFGSAAFAIDFWMKPADAGINAYILGRSNADPGVSSHGWEMRLHQGKIRVLGVNDWVFNITSDTSITADEWHHVALTSSAATVDLYIDGVYKGSSDRSPISSASNPFRIGYTPTHTGTPFSGLIDEVEIFNRALSAPELAAIYNAGTAGRCKPCVAPPSGLVSWWAGDDNAQDMTGANPGALMNGATFADGKAGRAFSFSGAGDYVMVPDSASLDITGAITMDAWIYRNDSTSEAGLLRKGAMDSNGVYSLAIYADKFYFRLNGDDLNLPTATSIPVGQWTHVAGTYDGTTARVYVNGVLDASRPYATPMGTDNNSLYIGLYGATTKYFPGRIDELKIFNRALSSAEIADIYNSGSGGTCKPCTAQPSGAVAWWRGDGTAVDALGTSHGTLQGGAGYDAGKVGQAFSLGGAVADYVSIPHSALFNPGGAFSLDGWFYIDPAANAKEISCLVSKWDAGYAQGWGLDYSSSTQGLRMSVRSTSGVHAGASLSGAVPSAAWYHVAGVFDPQAIPRVKLYVNGLHVGSSSVLVDDAGANNFDVRIGACYWTENYAAGNDRLSGKADEIEFFTRALASDEIAALYNAGCAGKCFTPQSVPAAFTFTDVTGAAPNDLLQSNEITVTGINVPTTVSLDAGHYALNGGPCNLVSGTARNGDKLVVCLAASGSYAATVSATLTVGTVSDTFSISTVSAHLISVEAVPSAARTFTPASWEVAEGGNIGINIIPNAGYYFVSGTDNCGPGGARNGAPYDSNRSYSVFSGTSDCTVTVTYAEYEVRREDGPVYHHTVQEAFSAVAAQDTIRLRELLFDETSTGGASYTGGFPVTLTGGAQSGFVPDLLKFSAITPGLVLSGGPVTISNIAIK